MRQIPLAISLEAPRSFENFLAGANRAVVSQLASLGSGAVPVYLWGPSGSGKTHLLQAVALRAEQEGRKVGWFGPDRPVPWEHSDAWTGVVIDDCEALDAAQQHAAFALFVEAMTHSIPVVAAGHLPPVDLPLREDLRSRLGWGPVFALQPLSEAEVRAALRREADRRGVFLTDEVMDFLLTRFARDLKHLMGLLDRLDAFALATKRAITVPLLKQMLNDEGAR
ncbi:MAG: DnaA regulatory inactivator Hda [Caldimonas sp.]